jgi:beta-lactamase regulating signal transducer with metallopeptidase domain
MIALKLLLIMSLGGTALGCLLLLVQRLAGKKLPSAFYYYAWLLVLARLALPLPGLVDLGSAQETAQAVTAVAQAAPEATLTAASTPSPTLAAPGLDTEITLQAVPVAQTETAPAAARSFSRSELWAGIAGLARSPQLWLTLWLGGGVLCFGWHVLAYRRFTQALRRVLLSARWSDQAIYQTFTPKRRPRLVRCRCVDTPMLVGFVHPLLVIPDRDYDPATLKHILRHELTHHRRGDIAYKWLAVAVFSLHWFNPFVCLFRRELDRLCELSCDEQLLRTMTAGEKQTYGETLLDLATVHSLPRSVVATTFATEKRTLKERLVQIMTYKHHGKKTIILVITALLILCACGAAMGPSFAIRATAAQTAEPTPEPVEAIAESTPEPVEAAALQAEDLALPASETITVSTVDEFLAAIGPNVTITLEPGTYDLSTASDYGTAHADGCYTWDEVNDGYELVIQNVTDLTITGTATADVTIVAVPRYADVISFQDCQNISLLSLTAGHTIEQSQCAGGVIDIVSSGNVVIQDTSLYGCGVVGVRSSYSSDIQVLDSTIYECSSGAVEAYGTTSLCIENCDIYDCGTDVSTSLFNLNTTIRVDIINNRIYNNLDSTMVKANAVPTLYFMGNDVYENQFDTLFSADIYSPVVSDCRFRDNQFNDAYGGAQTAVLPDGTALSLEDLSSMTLAAATYDADTMTETIDPVALNEVINPDGSTEVYVSNVNELLSAIGPNVTIYLEPGEYNLFESDYYGINVSDYCTWVEYGTGTYGLVITGVENLQIIGSGADNTQIITTPREDNVITFQDCNNLLLTKFTAGHTIIPDSTCQGDVLVFQNSDSVDIVECGLFGCGVWGIRANTCNDISVESSEIYDCSGGGAILYQCKNVAFTDSSIHDCSGPDFSLISCKNVTWDGEPVTA